MSLTRTREFCSRVCTSGIWAWIVKLPGPPPFVPGNGNVLAPWKSRRLPQLETRWRGVVGPQPVLAIRDFVGTGVGVGERVEPQRKEVVLTVLDDRRQVLHT